MINLKEDLLLARTVRRRSKCSCSKYAVGAVLKTKNGNRYCGCNIENDGIQSICAERVAFAKAISDGEYEFERILVVGAPENSDVLDKCLPCGYCRQFISQFVDKDFKIYNVHDEKVEEYTMEELLPYDFHLNNK